MKKISVDFKMVREGEVAETCIDLSISDEVFQSICVDKDRRGDITELRALLWLYSKLMGYRLLEVEKIEEVVQGARLRGDEVL